jgi:Sulfotransferase family
MVPHAWAAEPDVAHNTSAMPGPRVRVVFIGGYARTGSTLLDRILGEIEGFASFGELRHIWRRSFRGDQLCGCGVPFRDCPFWIEVANVAFGGFDGVDADAIGRLERGVGSFWNIPRIATGGWPAGYRRRLDAYRDALERLYGAIQRVSGARYLVDSTKDPQHAYVLRSIPGFDVRVVHLVRDSRAVAYSWRRQRRRPEIHWRDLNMPRYPAIRSAFAWDLANITAGAARAAGFPYVRVRYEDLMRDPRGELDRIVRALALGPVDLSHVGATTVHLTTAHTTAGNPIRFQEGTVALRLDDEWRSRMATIDRSVVSALTFPWLRRYGYAIDGRVEPAGIARDR